VTATGFNEEQGPFNRLPDEVEAPFEMTNLYPKRTGLPMTVWVSPRGHARHDARVKVCVTHGNRMVLDDAAVVGIRPEPRLIAGALSPQDMRMVARWIELNRTALIEHWNGEIDGLDLSERLVRLEAGL
jgi:hypothetical protein